MDVRASFAEIPTLQGIRPMGNRMSECLEAQQDSERGTKRVQYNNYRINLKKNSFFLFVNVFLNCRVCFQFDLI